MQQSEIKNSHVYCHRKSGFTLIELLIVIGIIAILAAAVIIAINPGRQFAQARDITREKHLQSLNQAILSYQIENQTYPITITTDYKEICDTNKTQTCGSLIDLSDLAPNYINSIPVDPEGGEETSGTGYKVALIESRIVFDSPNLCGKTYTDPRDNQTYSTVKVGNQCWMAENLNHDNGCAELEWQSNNDKGWCGYYENTQEEYGLLYQWSGALDVCPSGWKLPSDSDWQELEVALGMSSAEASEEGWRWSGNVGESLAYFTGGDNSSGLNILPGGRRLCNGDYHQGGEGNRHWTADGTNGNAYHRHLWQGASPVYRNDYAKCHAMSVRCVRE